MPFLLFLILVLILVNSVSLMKLMFRMSLFVIFASVIAFTSYAFFSFSESDLSAMANEPTLERSQPSSLNYEIRKLRNDLKQANSLAEKKTLMKHLQGLEKLLRQQEDENLALKNLKADKVKLYELRKLQKSLEAGKKKFEQESKRLLDLQKQILRSEKLMEKLNSVDNLTKGIKHD
jgi:hypothetical protein